MESGVGRVEGPYHQTSIVRSEHLGEITQYFLGVGGTSSGLFQWLRASYVISSDRIDPIFFRPSEAETEPDKKLKVSGADIIELKRRVAAAYDDIRDTGVNNRSLKTVAESQREGLVRITRRRASKPYSVTLSSADYNNLKARVAANIGEQANTEEGQNLVNAHIFQILKRYTQPFSIFQYDPKLPRGYYDLLSRIGARHHVISAPLANVYPTFGTLFPDLDSFVQPAGTVTGDVLLSNSYRLSLRSGSHGEVLELNLTGYGYLYTYYLDRLSADVLTGSGPLTIFVVYDRPSASATRPQISLGPLDLSGNRQIVVLQNDSGRLQNLLDDRFLDQLRASLAIPGQRQVVPTKVREVPPLEVNGRITSPYLTVYEKAKLLGSRAKQLATEDARPLVPVDRSETDLLAIAEREFFQVPERFPIQLVRPLPDGTSETWFAHELIDPTNPLATRV